MRDRENLRLLAPVRPEGVSLRRLVATFLAVLELTRLRKLRSAAGRDFADIACETAAGTKLA
jgi:hypothetical protein